MDAERPHRDGRGQPVTRRTALLSAAAVALTACRTTVASGAHRSTAAVTGRPSPTGATSSAAPSASAATTTPVAASSTPAPSETPSDTVPAASLTPEVVRAELTRLTPPTLTTAAQRVPHGTVDALPGSAAGNGLALTVDDGIDSSVVSAYLAFVEATGVRLTFFVNGVNASWTDHVDRLRPLVDAGTVQLGNHTWSHPDLRRQSDRGVRDELQRNHDFLVDTYGVDARPFYRPPFGFHDARVDRIAADLGYTTTVMWYGSLSDSSVLTETVLLTQAQKWLLPGAVVIGHANHPTVTHVFPQIVDLVRQRALHPVTLRDVYVP